VRIVVALCSVTYTGRGSTELPRAVRAILIKSDGAISIHADTGNKPLNYMGAGNVFTPTRRGPQHVWTFSNRKETLEVRIHRLISDSDFDLDALDPGLSRDRTEHHLQAWLADHPEALGDGYTFVAREYQTGAGAVDLLVRDADGNYVAVEVKRTAMLGAVDQVHRYVTALNMSGDLGSVTGMVAALDVRPNTAEQADRRGIPYVTVRPDWAL
jgi:RecB family endonuclease NucS